MRRVILESPYAGEVTLNKSYAMAALKDCIRRGEAPMASHLLYTLVLDDTVPYERDAGIYAGYAWMEAADTVVFYIDRGWSKGMLQALHRARSLSKPTEVRSIYGKPEPHEAPQ